MKPGSGTGPRPGFKTTWKSVYPFPFGAAFFATGDPFFRLCPPDVSRIQTCSKPWKESCLNLARISVAVPTATEDHLPPLRPMMVACLAILGSHDADQVAGDGDFVSINALKNGGLLSVGGFVVFTITHDHPGRFVSQTTG